ncbi:hypothetical protein EIP91_000044 [Steccherinum ochraceum]|uniref:Major facilitator superfamily (MFS) profile domain-containing protein n=1 Tax=Steccherinum ochraceum TaxID=92696 RepID=A0A4R0RX33_9APHY|nr:hypothetical protein EIP91_000044 [Steccherinum ochraceum]
MSATRTETRAGHSTLSLKGSSLDHGTPIITPLSRIPTKSSKIDAIQLAELASPSGGDGTSEEPHPGPSFPAITPEMRRKANIQFITLCWTLFLGGWMGGTTGPLLPRIQQVYHVGFAVVSLLFVFNCLGSIVASVINVYLCDRIGFGWVLVIGAAVQVAGYAVSAVGPPFTVLVFSYFVTGFGVALQDANASAYIASLRVSSPTRMGIMHSIYGFGAFCAPLVATQFAAMPKWSFHFLVSLGITIPNIITLAMVFKFKRQHELLAEIGQPLIEHATAPSPETGTIYREMMKQKALHILTLFMFVYLGIGLAIGGWIVTYLVDKRGGGASTGYVSSGLYGGKSPPILSLPSLSDRLSSEGVTVGRLVLIWFNKKIGERRAVVLYSLIALAMQLIIWFVPSLIGNAVAVSISGLFLGPIYPIVMNQTALIIPPHLRTGCISWIGGFGQAGSAFMPFVTGALASSRGIECIQPLIVSMLAFMLAMWLLVPKGPSRSD